MTAQATFAAVLVDEWARAGVTDAVVAPGSRSTPLLMALAADGRLRVHVVLDERSAGFVALGLGLSSGRPAVVVTTSGTAAVELHPAIVEAEQAGVPLIAVTADRPPELHGVGAPQTVPQDGLFGGSVRWALTPGVADRAAAGSWRSMASRAVAEACSGPGGPGPVHLNLAFREPLGGSVEDPPPGRPGGRPWHQVVAGVEGVEGVEGVADRLAGLAGRRGLIVAGAGVEEAAEAVGATATALGWPVLADPRSGCRVPATLTVAAADGLLRTPLVAGWQPEIVLRLGRPWASRVVSTWLAGMDRSVEQVLIDPFGRWADPERTASLVARCSVGALVSAVAERVGSPPVDRPWVDQWSRAESAAQRAIDRVLAAHREVTEPGVAREVVDALPRTATLFVSSSMPVRDVEWFARPRHGLRVLANRGANGIDGIVSTALGIAAAGTGPAVALSGDLAFLYDAGALLWAVDRGLDCTLVVVDNDGGGIFSFLPQAGSVAAADFERLWGTPHGIDLGQVAAAYRIPVEPVEKAADVAPAITAALENGGVRMVHVRTDRQANVAVHAELQAAIAGEVAASAAP